MTSGDKESKEQETARLSIEDLRRLLGVTRWLKLLFGAGTIFGWCMGGTIHNVLFAAMGACLGWCVLACLIQHLFLGAESGDRADAEYNEKLTQRRVGKSSDPLVTRMPFLPDLAGRWQWAIFFAGVVILAGIFRAEFRDAQGLEGQETTALRVATVGYLAAS